MPKLASRPQPRPTHALVWCAAIICAIISIAVIFGSIILLASYVAIHPQVPFLSILNAQLDLLSYDQAGILDTQVTITIRAVNGNEKAHVTFYNTTFKLSFEGRDIAILLTPQFKVNKNSSRDFTYVVPSHPVPLGPSEMQELDLSLKRDLIKFNLKGSSRARWRLGPVGSVKFLCHLDCNLKFRESDRSYVPSRCTSQTHKH